MALGVADLPAANDNEEEVFHLWDTNERPFRAFLGLATQWRWTMLSSIDRAVLVRTGLDYSAIPVVLRSLGFRDSDGEIFDGIQLLENEALGVLQRHVT